MSHYTLIDGPLRGHAVEELPEGYEVSETSDRIGVWTQSRIDSDELYASALAMDDAANRIETQVLSTFGDGIVVAKDSDETDAALRAFREARERQARVLRRMTSDPH
ncbi:hypothetical protein [Microbacterium sp. SLBN-111]|uniref:hypothetical protein n=1 Tax=Microbacterium sp. SLBN-111 TaxID=3377733 RepID=UPI003C751234